MMKPLVFLRLKHRIYEWIYAYGYDLKLGKLPKVSLNKIMETKDRINLWGFKKEMKY